MGPGKEFDRSGKERIADLGRTFVVALRDHRPHGRPARDGQKPDEDQGEHNNHRNGEQAVFQDSHRSQVLRICGFAAFCLMHSVCRSLPRLNRYDSSRQSLGSPQTAQRTVPCISTVRSKRFHCSG